MNLKDRKTSERKESEPSRKPVSSIDIMPELRQPSPEQTLLSQAQSTIQELTKTASSLQTQLDAEKAGNAEKESKISTLSSQNSTLLSKMQEMQSTMEKLKGELLTAQNLIGKIVEENDDLRNRKGLKTLKEQKLLRRENEALKASNDKLREQVDMSNVEAVISAQDAKAKSEREYKMRIDSLNQSHSREFSDASRKLREANRKYESLSKKQTDKRAADLLTHFFVFLCCIPRGLPFFDDLWTAVSAPFLWLFDDTEPFSDWLASPYYYESNVKIVALTLVQIWLFRIISIMLLLAFFSVLFLGIGYLIYFCIKYTCALSLRIAYCTLVMLIVTPLSQIISFNLFIVFGILQILCLAMIRYLDEAHEYGWRENTWSYIRNL